MSLNMTLQTIFAARHAAFPSVPESIKINIKEKGNKSQHEDSKQVRAQSLGEIIHGIFLL